MNKEELRLRTGEHSLEQLESMSENDLCYVAEMHEDDDISSSAMLILRLEYDSSYFWCPDCDGLVTKGCASCTKDQNCDI